jgi:hypothetical protein
MIDNEGILMSDTGVAREPSLLGFGFLGPAFW